MSSIRVALVTVASATALAALTAVPTSLARAADTPAEARAWAAFRTNPDASVSAADNLQWYVTTTPVTPDQVGRTITLEAQSTAFVDCDTIGLGYPSANGWTNIKTDQIDCTATRVTARFWVSELAIGQRVQLTGWSTVRGTEATVSGLSTVNSVSSPSTTTTTRETVPTPVGPMTRLGSHHGKPVYLSAQNGVNEVWVGDGGDAVRYAGTEGVQFHVEQFGSKVVLWLGAMPNTVRLWTLDLTTGKTSTRNWWVQQVQVGKPGIWLATGAPAREHRSILMDWQGTIRQNTPFRADGAHMRLHGFTADAALFLDGGVVQTKAVLVALDGSRTATAGADTLLQVESISDKGAVVKYLSNPTTQTRCLLTLDGCQPLG
ncbi:hypothetical protein ACTQ49_14575 [Luteococcus sp. Sow4_B9]|uniref:hypothetical protein n=1 Tax=Luteococcus sp. Sow4_B9 TaxID=3438792 RepID=UPI003F9C3910